MHNLLLIYLHTTRYTTFLLNYDKIHVIIKNNKSLMMSEKMESIIYSLLKATAKILKDVSLPIYIGILLSNLSRRGMFEGVAQNSLGKLAEFLKLPRECAMSIMLSLGDRMAGMGMLMVAKHKQLISDREIVATNLIAKLPSVLQFFIVSFIPIIMSLFPSAIAIKFLGLYLLSFALISCCGFVYLRSVSSAQHSSVAALDNSKKVDKSWRSLGQAIQESLRPCLRTLSVLAVMTFLALWFSRSGVLETLGSILPIDSRLLPIMMVGMLSMLAGIMAVGAELQAGVIDSSQILPLLFTISILHNIYDLFAASLPRTFAVFGSSLGAKVALISFAVTQAVMLIMLLAVSY